MFVKKIPFIVISLCTFLLLFLVIKGVSGNPSAEQINKSLKTAGKPFELSPERNRYSQLIALVEYKSFDLPLNVAKTVVPDLGYSDGKYISIYPPGLTVLFMPFYIIGRFVGLSQLFTFLVPLISAFLCFLLIIKISVKLDISKYAGILAGFIFLFATSSWAYGGSLYQHLFSKLIDNY
jgi:hypothetical protein